MGDLQNGKCAETREGIMVGSLLRCGLLAGHPGQHHDPNDVDWSSGTSDNGTVEYAVREADGTEMMLSPYQDHCDTLAQAQENFGHASKYIDDARIFQRSAGPWTPVDPKDSSE